MDASGVWESNPRPHVVATASWRRRRRSVRGVSTATNEPAEQLPSRVLPAPALQPTTVGVSTWRQFRALPTWGQVGVWVSASFVLLIAIGEIGNVISTASRPDEGNVVTRGEAPPITAPVTILRRPRRVRLSPQTLACHRVNDGKGDADPSNWIPPAGDAVCPYLVDWIGIKARWGLSMDQSEHGRIANLLAEQCSGQLIAPWPVTAPAQRRLFAQGVSTRTQDVCVDRRLRRTASWSRSAVLAAIRSYPKRW